MCFELQSYEGTARQVKEFVNKEVKNKKATLISVQTSHDIDMYIVWYWEWKDETV